jgi:hypothetical protein
MANSWGHRREDAAADYIIDVSATTVHRRGVACASLDFNGSTWG